MRCFLSIAVACLSASPALYARDGVPPRPDGTDYPVHRKAPNATIAAAQVPLEMGKKLFPAEVYKNYVVVEVAVFPHAGATVDVDAFDFGLKIIGAGESYPRSAREIALVWEEKNAPQNQGKVDVNTEVGLVYASGKDPVNGRYQGWGTYAGVGVGPAQPNQPPPATNPQLFETNVRGRALPEGSTAQPVAGYLYFPLPSKKVKSGPMELRYMKDGVLTSLPIPAK